MFIFTVLSFFISKLLFIKLALKDIFHISNKLKNIDLNNITKIKLDKEWWKIIIDLDEKYLIIKDNWIWI